MNRSLKLTTAGWPEAVGLVVLLGLTFLLGPGTVPGAILGTLLTIGAVWAFYDGIRDRWDASGSTGSFLGYYGRLVVVASVILLLFVLSVMGVAKLYVG